MTFPKLFGVARYAMWGAAIGALIALMLTMFWQITDRALPYSSNFISFRESLMSIVWPPSLTMMGATTRQSVVISWLFAVITNAILYALVGALVYAGRYKTKWAFLPIVVGVIWVMWITLGIS